MARDKHYIELTAAECRLAYNALMQFRNDVIAKGVDPVDINGLILRLVKLQKKIQTPKRKLNGQSGPLA